jgi:hypothetical protein
MSGSPNYVMSRYRFRTDAGAVEDTPTWGAAENTTYAPGVDSPFRLRVGLDNTGTASGNVQYRIRYRVKEPGGAFGAYASASTTSAHVRTSTAASSSGDNAALSTARLTAGGGSWVNGQYDNNGVTANINLTAGNHSEVEYGLILNGADFTVAGTYDIEFRVYNNVTELNGYTVTATTSHTVVVSGDEIDAPFLVSAALVFAGAVVGGAALAAAFIASSAAVHAATISSGAPSGSVVEASFVAPASTVYAPEVAAGIAVEAPFVASIAAVYAPEVSAGSPAADTVTAPFLASAAMAYAPSVAGGVSISAPFVTMAAASTPPAAGPGSASGRPLFRPWFNADDVRRGSAEWSRLLNQFMPAIGETWHMVGLGPGGGVTLTSPDGGTVKVLRLSDAGALELIDP